MSYTLTPIAVDLDRVRAAIGSRDDSLLARLPTEYRFELDQIDRLLEDMNDDEGGGAGPVTAADVLRHLVVGEPRRDGIGYAYGYGLELLCRYFGRTLPNGGWCSMRWEWFEAVQEELGRAGVGGAMFSVPGLASRGSPIPLPAIADFPGIGYLTRAEVGAVRAALAAADLARVADADAAESIEEVRGWLETCERANCDLICFYA